MEHLEKIGAFEPVLALPRSHRGFFVCRDFQHLPDPEGIPFFQFVKLHDRPDRGVIAAR